MKDLLKSDILTRYYKDELMRQLTAENWLTMYGAYKVEDKRPWWRRKLALMRSRIYWATLGRFRNWLHRDCGTDY